MKKLVSYVLIVLSAMAGVNLNADVNKSQAPLPMGRFSVGPSLGLLNGVAGFGVDTNITFNAGPSIYVGFQTGFYRWAQSATSGTTSASVSLNSIPLLVTAIYKVNIERNSIHPYAGLALGMAIDNGNVSATSGTDSASVSKTVAHFNGLLRLGIEIDMSPGTALYIEPKLGLLSDQFVFLPGAGLAFSF